MKKCSTKWWKVMKICATLAMIPMIVCGVSAANVSDAQLLDRKITIHVKDVPMEQALYRIQDAARVKIFFSLESLETKGEGIVSIEAKDQPLGKVLDDLLSPHSIRYKVDERKNSIIILKKNSSRSDVTGGQATVSVPRTRSPEINDMITVTGIVTDAATQQPMAGVNIVVKGTTNGTTTDADGKYTISVMDGDVLVFSFIGYKTIEEQVGGRNTIEVMMEEDATTLAEVILNGGYYTTTGKTATGNIAKVLSNEISGQPVSNTLQGLQGRMAGVEIVQLSGVPGASMKIQIRGQNSLRTEGNYPLYVIDGVPVLSEPIRSYGLLFGGIDPLNAINPENIESIEVLKDADATSIYGSRGANGVVLITTKKGIQTQTKTGLEVSFYTGAGWANQIDNLMNTRQYLEMRKEAIKNHGSVPQPMDYDLTAWDTTRHTNWQDALFGGTAKINDVQLGLTGGNATTSFRLGGGYHKETTVFPGDFGFQRISGSLNVNHNSVDQKLKAQVSINYGADNNDLFSTDIVNTALNLAPLAPPLYNEDGELNWQIVNATSTWQNPLAPLRISQNIKSHNLLTNAVLGYEILPGLIIKANIGYSTLSNGEIIKTPMSRYDPTLPAVNKINRTQVTKNQSNSWIIEPQITYRKAFGNGTLDALLGTTWQANYSQIFSVTGSEYTSDALLGSISSARVISIAGEMNSEYKYNAIFGRIGYTWRDKYIVNATGRRDGSSRFGPDRRFANFGSVGAAWVFSNEKLFQHTFSFISYGKLRTSYGTTGSDQIGNYGYLDVYGPTIYEYEGLKGLYPTTLANPEYAWEVNKKFESALEVGLLNDRVLLTSSWYKNHCSNQLVGYPLPIMTGFRSVIANFDATVENTGWEFVLNSINIQTNGFEWSTSFNFTIPRNKLVSYPNIEGSSYASRYVVGQPLNIRKLFHLTGVNPQTGLYEFGDVNGDGAYTIADMHRIVNMGRQYYGGVMNNLRYQGFSLNFLIEFVKQNGFNEFTVFDQPGSFNSGAQPVSRLERWQKEGDIAKNQKFGVFTLTYGRAVQSDASVGDASFIRLKTVSLEYNLNREILSRLKLSSCKVYLQGQNLLTLTNFVGLDPQSPANNLPALKVMTGGIRFAL